LVRDLVGILSLTQNPNFMQTVRITKRRKNNMKRKLMFGVMVAFSILICASSWTILSSEAGRSDDWHVQGDPKVIAQEIRFTSGDARLAGTVYLPESGGDRLPAVVALHSALAATRNAGIYRHLREGLPPIGFAVLIYDRRGSGASSGDLKGSDYETLADDAIAGQNALAKLPRIDPTKIGFWGLSQGGWLAVLAAERGKHAAFAISVSAPLVTPEEQMQFATTNLLNVRGYSQEDAKQMLAIRRAWTGYLKGTNSRAVAVEELGKAETRPWFDLAFMPKASQLTTDPEHSSWRREMSTDLLAAIRKVKAPLCFIYGGSDPWIPVRRSVEELRSLKNQRHNIAYAVVPNASHEMMFVEHETMAFDEKTVNENAPQAPEYFMVMTSWLCRTILGVKSP
jgi:pimeloyl-ACP methyl ester carboxylesterase